MEAAAQKLLSSVRKRLAQIARLEARRADGSTLDWQQELKIAQSAALQRAQSALQDGEPAECASTALHSFAVVMTRHGGRTMRWITDAVPQAATQWSSALQGC